MKQIIILLLSCFTLFSCVNNVRVNKENDVTDAGIPDKNIIESVSPYSGEYKGILPCADCPGIETTLTLEKDGNFALHLVYIDEKDGIFDEKGTYIVNDSIITLKTNAGEEQYYKVETNKLRRLNADKEVITGQLADNYILVKK